MANKLSDCFDRDIGFILYASSKETFHLSCECTKKLSDLDRDSEIQWLKKEGRQPWRMSDFPSHLCEGRTPERQSDRNQIRIRREAAEAKWVGWIYPWWNIHAGLSWRPWIATKS